VGGGDRLLSESDRSCPQRCYRILSFRRCLATQQRWHEAVAEYRKSVEIEPNSLESQDHLGFALAQLQRWDEAIDSYRKAIELAPTLMWFIII
jgi:tetratricopeptide (TPR) repeat protein